MAVAKIKFGVINHDLFPKRKFDMDCDLGKNKIGFLGSLLWRK